MFRFEKSLEKTTFGQSFISSLSTGGAYILAPKSHINAVPKATPSKIN